MISRFKYLDLLSILLAFTLTFVWSVPMKITFAFHGHPPQTPLSSPSNINPEAGLNGNTMEYAFLTTTHWTTLGTHIPSGNGLMRVNLFEIPTAGIDISFGITYNSAYKDQNLGLGKGWMTDLHAKVLADPNSGNVNYLTSTGTQLEFVFDPQANEFINPKGFAGKLKVHGDGSISFTDLDLNTMHFDQNGDLSSISACSGGSLDIDYNQDGHPVSITDPVSLRSIDLQWNQEGLLEAVLDPLNHTWKFDYDTELDHLVSIEQPRLEEDDPVKTYFDYNQSHLMTQQTTFEENFVLIRYHENSADEGKVAEWEDAHGNITSFDYEGPDQQYAGKTTVTNANQLATNYYIGNISSQIELIEDVAGQETLQTFFDYTPQGWISSTTDNAGNVYQFAYNNVGRLTSIEYPPAMPGFIPYVQQWEYDSSNIDGRLILYQEKITPSLWATTQYIYEDPLVHCYPTRMIHPDNTVSTASFNSLGQPLSMTNDPQQLNQTVEKTYAPNGNLTSTIDPEGNETTYLHDSNGRVKQKTVFEGASTLGQVQKIFSFDYNFAGQLMETAESISNVIISDTFNLDGSKQCKEGYEYCGMCFFYEPIGGENPLPVLLPDYRRPIDKRHIPDDPRTPFIITPSPPFRPPVAIIEDSNGLNTYNEYDSVGNRISTTNAHGQTIQYSFDDFNRLTTIQDFDGKTTNLSYDSMGNVSARTVSGIGTWTYTRDMLGRIVQINDPIQGTLQYGYNLRGDLISDHKGSYSYDNMGRKVSANYHGGGNDQWTYRADGTLASYNGIQYQHNLMGLLTQWSDGTNQATIEYRSSLGLPTMISGQNQLSSYIFEYDNHARPSRVLDTSKQIGGFEFSWSGSNKLEQLISPSQVVQLYQYQFGKPSTISVSKGTNTYYSSSASFNNHGHYTEFEYNQAPSYEGSYTFDYNTLMQLESIAWGDESRTITYGYNQQSGLMNSVEFSDLGTYTLNRNPNGQLQSVNRPHHQGTEDYAYHPNGKLQSVTLPQGQALQFSWDGRGRINQFTVQEQSTQTTYSFNYNTLGLMTGKSKSQDGFIMENWQYAYGPAGLERASRLVMGMEDLVLNFSRDIQGKCLSISYHQQGGYQGEIIPHYNQQGRMVLVTDPQGNMLASFDHDLITGKVVNEWNPQEIHLPFHGPSSAMQIDLPFGAQAHSLVLTSSRQWSLQMDWGSVEPLSNQGGHPRRHPMDPKEKYEEFLSWDCRCGGWDEFEGELLERDRQAIERELRRRGIRNQDRIDEILDEIEQDINACCTTETEDGEGGFKSADAATLVFGTGRGFEKWIQCKLLPEVDGEG